MGMSQGDLNPEYFNVKLSGLIRSNPSTPLSGKFLLLENSDCTDACDAGGIDSQMVADEFRGRSLMD